MTGSVYEVNHFNIKDEHDTYVIDDRSPLTSFLYALKSSEAKRQYPARLKKFFDYIGIRDESINVLDPKEELNKQSISFLERALRDQKWALDSILSFLGYLISKQQKGEITAGTIKNYYRSIKLFCEMNDLDLRWKKVRLGLPKSRDLSKESSNSLNSFVKETLPFMYQTSIEGIKTILNECWNICNNKDVANEVTWMNKLNALKLAKECHESL